MKRKSAALLLVLFFLTASCVTMATPLLATSEAENTWTPKAPLPPSMDRAVGAATVNGKIYAMSLSFNYEYDPTTDTWTEKASMPTPRANFAIAVFQNKIYVIGAYGYSCANEVYDPATDTWESKTPMPTNRTYLSACVFGGKIHLFSREGHDVYEIATDSWTEGTENPYQVLRPKSTVIDDKVYVISWNLTEIYDPNSDTWSLGATAPVAVSNPGVCSTTGIMAPKRIYVCGGEVSFTVATDVTQVYDPENDSWTLGASMPIDSIGLEAVVIDDVIFTVGGSHGWLINDYANLQYIPFGYGTAPPVIYVVSPVNQTYNVSIVSLDFMVNKPAVWIGYSLDGRDNVTVNGNVTIEGLSNGLHNVTVYARDDLGNTGVSETIKFSVEVPFPSTMVITSVVIVAFVGLGLLVYFKKHKH
jgi:N-acetylneuraminic acid mutarotase